MKTTLRQISYYLILFIIDAILLMLLLLKLLKRISLHPMKNRSAPIFLMSIPILVALYFSYYLLLKENFLHCTTAAIIHYANTLSLTQHFLVVALLPIYVALIIFGAISLSIYLTPKFGQLFKRR